MPTVYRSDSEIVLAWKIVPPDGHLLNTKCYFTSQHANKEILISVLDKGKQATFHNGLLNERTTAIALGGYFNITIKSPKENQKGSYRCVFTTEEGIAVSANILLLGGTSVLVSFN